MNGAAPHTAVFMLSSRWMKTCLLSLLLLFPLLGAGAPQAIPEPAELEPDVRFWMRVYSEISTNQGFIHDQRNLAVVYETLRFDPELPPREIVYSSESVKLAYSLSARR